MRLGILLALLVVGCSNGEPSKPANGSDATAVEASGMYDELRDMALAMKPGDLGLNASGNSPYGIVMDIDIDGSTATVTSFSTGDASLYLSSGGGTIGGGEHESVARAAKRFVEAAAANVPAMAPAATHPRPGPGQVTFYLLTPQGIFSASRAEQDLGEGQSDLSDLFYAGQDVLTAMRQQGG